MKQPFGLHSLLTLQFKSVVWSVLGFAGFTQTGGRVGEVEFYHPTLGGQERAGSHGWRIQACEDTADDTVALITTNTCRCNLINHTHTHTLEHRAQLSFVFIQTLNGDQQRGRDSSHEWNSSCRVRGVCVCVCYVLHIYWSEFNDGQEGNMHSHQNKLYNHNVWYIIHCTKILIFF